MAREFTLNTNQINMLTNKFKEAGKSELLGPARDILQDKNLYGILNQVINPYTAGNQQAENDFNLWNIYKTKTKEGYSGYIDYDNRTGGDENNKIDTMKYIKEAIDARHRALRHSSDFMRGSQDCSANINETINTFRAEEIANFIQLKHIADGILSSYEVASQLNNNMNVLKNGKLNELKGVKSKIDTYKQNLHIDGRKNDYNVKNYEFYKSIYFYVLIVYYFLLGLYFIYSDFYSTEKYKNKYYIIALILYIIFPFLLNYILFYIYYAYEYYLEFYNLKEEVVSYPDIVNKYHDK